MATGAEQREVLEACQGSLAAFEALVHRYEHRVYAFIAQYCRRHHDASELTQDTFVRAFDALPSFDPGQPFAPWLFTIARRKCIDFHRRQPLPAEELSESFPAPDDSPDAALAEQDAARDFWSRIRTVLPPIQYEAVWLHYNEEMGVREIAHVLGKSSTHVKVILFRARQALAREFATAAGGRDQVPLSSAVALNLKANSEV